MKRSERSLLLTEDVGGSGPRPVIALAAKGFRPFFLLAAGYAALAVPLWLAILGGKVAPGVYLDLPSWHAHEMIFGFTAAVIAGFLLTAVGNWTKRETLVGAPLLGLAGVWIAGRVAMVFASSLPRGIPAVVDLAFLPLLVVALAVPIVATKNRRNLVMLAVLGGLFAADVVVHLDALGIVAPGSARRACLVALDLVVVVIAIIAGRVFPMFTRNATGVTTIRSNRVLDVATIAGLVVVTIVDGVAADVPHLADTVAGAVGVLAGARALHWGARHSLREPLLWILHGGYAWIVVGLVLRAVCSWGGLPSSLPAHAITVGGIGGLTLGMMARVSLGHTGSALAAAPAVRWAFAAMMLAALARVVAPVSEHYLDALMVSGALWSVAFAIFLVVYTPLLLQARRDGRPG